jgi:hypothetical protein
MSEQNKPFVVTDRRKFTAEGELRPDAPPSEERERHDPPAVTAAPAAEAPVDASPASSSASSQEEAALKEELPPLTEEQVNQARTAYQATAERLDTAIRASNPGMEHPPTMSFEQIVHSVYMTAIMQLGGATPEGQQPQVDLMGARQSIDMLGVLAEKTKGNLTPEEARLLENALFELHMGFLEITQALARSAAAKAQSPGSAPGRPSIVR